MMQRKRISSNIRQREFDAMRSIRLRFCFAKKHACAADGYPGTVRQQDLMGDDAAHD